MNDREGNAGHEPGTPYHSASHANAGLASASSQLGSIADRSHRVVDGEIGSRVVKLESDVQHIASALQETHKVIRDTNASMSKGFEETRKMFESLEQRSESRDTVLHRELSQQANRFQQMLAEQQKETLQQKQWSMPIVISVIFAVIAVGGMGVGFINMSLVPIKEKLDQSLVFGIDRTDKHAVRINQIESDQARDHVVDQFLTERYDKLDDRVIRTERDISSLLSATARIEALATERNQVQRRD